MVRASARFLPSRGLAAAACVLLALALGSCANINAETMQFVGVPQYPAGNPDQVEILRTEPRRPHIRLGEISIEASTDPAPPIEQIEEKLRSEAAKIGANAVVVVHDRIQQTGTYVTGPWWGRSVESVSGRKLIGVAIRYD